MVAREINSNSFKANNEDNTELEMAHKSLKCAVLCVQKQVCGSIFRCTEGFPLQKPSVSLFFNLEVILSSV